VGARHTYREVAWACGICGHRARVWTWDHQYPPDCPSCLFPLTKVLPAADRAATVIGDACDVVVEHGLCWPGGAPRRYTSKSEMAREAWKRGLTNYVRHVPLPGTDRSPHTVSWDTGPAPGADPRPMAWLSPEEQAARAAQWHRDE